MGKIMRFCLFACYWFLCIELSHAQMLSIKPEKPIICYQGKKDNPDRIRAPAAFQKWKESRSARLKTANFEIEYINFPADNQAKNAFQFAVDLWETQLSSPVTIKLRAQWASLDAGVLGQAIWGSAHANFDGAQHNDTFYPVALAEKMAGQELNPSTDPDVVATFSSNANWYLGTDGNTPAGKMDLVTVVLHEIAHGLGFTDTYDGEESAGSVGLESGGVRVPFVYDLFVENATGQKLFSQFLSPSVSLKNQLVSNQLFFNSPLMTSSIGARPKIFAPSPYDGGSSIAHLDEATFITPGDANKLMTPQIGAAESIHSLGSILLNIFSDLGWVFTRIEHAPLKDTERKDGNPYVMKAKITSDNGYDQGEVVLHYTIDNINFTEVDMTPTGEPDEFQAALPGVTTDWAYGYFISVSDVLNRTFTYPGITQAQNKPAEQGLITFNIGDDIQEPEIVHTPVEYIFDDENSLFLSAEVTDNLGVATVVAEYSIKGGALQTISMQKTVSSDEYTATISLPTLVIGDNIEYSIIAKDNSSNANQKQTPATGFHTVFVTGIMPAQDSYVNNFDAPTNDFIGNSFSITTPAGFQNGAIHSSHPYDDGSGPNDESNYIYQLQIPVRINNNNPVIQFDQIVLVEPGEDGSVFGDQDFYDYVIVEGSVDEGVTWKPFEDGLDSRFNTVWLTRFNSNVTTSNSNAVGDPTLFREHTIDMLDAGNFAPGDEVLIRFRLFADQASHGWGWAIDNLSVQGGVTGLEQHLAKDLNVYPNPATTDIFIEIAGLKNEPLNIKIMNLQGQIVFNEMFENDEHILPKEIDIRSLPDGLFMIKTQYGSKTFSRKFVKTHD
jgi:hypothetical protein